MIHVQITTDDEVFVAEDRGEMVEHKVIKVSPDIPDFWTEGRVDGLGLYAYQFSRNTWLDRMLTGDWYAFRSPNSGEKDGSSSESDTPVTRVSLAVFVCDEM